MACSMQNDPTGVDDFLAPAGATVTMVFTATSPNYRLISATYQNVALTVTADSTVAFDVKPGTTLLNVVQVCPGADMQTMVHVTEDCGDGTNNQLRDQPFQKLDGYRIRSL